jgi:hypothetical protein
MMNNRRVVLSAGIGRLSDDDSSHVLDCTLPWAMRGWRDHPPDPAFRRTAPRKETTGAGPARTVAMQSLRPRLLSRAQRRALAQVLNPQAKSPRNISAATTSAEAAS